MVKRVPYCRWRKNAVVLGNANAEVVIDSRLGRLHELTLRASGYGRWNQIPGWTEVVDELDEKTFRDGVRPAAVRMDLVEGEQGRGVQIRKRFRGAAFTIREIWLPTPDEILWSVRVSLDPGRPARSLQIRQFVPWPRDPYGWNIWTAQQHFPKLLAHLGNHRIVYGDVCFGTVVPMTTIYRPAADVGLSVAKPFGLKVPQWGFEYGTYHFGGLKVESLLLGLRPDRDAFVSLMLRAHAGCWRPGLGWLVKKYPEYFRPGHPEVEKIEGGFMGGSPFSTDRDCRLARRAGARVVEVHGHFKHYGNYYPDEPHWKTIHWIEHPEDARRQHLPDNSPALMNRTLARFRRHGILSLPYIQLAGDGWAPWVEKVFPESIALNRDGQKIPVWKNCWMMNSDPKYPFGRFIDEQIDRFFQRHGDAADGLFWDQPCYDAIDIAHDDGITMVDNRPAYRLVFCYEKHAQKMVAELRRRRQFLYANGPVYIELCRGVDAIMAEGVSWTADVDQYMCAARPMCFYSYFQTLDQLEEMFQKCLLLGGTCYSAHPRKLTRPMQRLYDIYRPMIDRLRGRTFCFDPNPLTTPFEVEGNVFRGGDGHVYVPLITRRASALDRGPARRLTLEVRLPDAARFVRATVQGTTYEGPRPARLKRDGRRLLVAVSEHAAASLVCLHRKGRT